MSIEASMVGAVTEFTQDIFMKLFVTQLKNQDPMEPMDNYEFTSQLAQMGQLEQLTNLTSAFERTLRMQEFGYAKSLIGATVKYMPEGSDVAQSGQVTAARLADGEVKLVVGAELVSLSAVTEVTVPASQSGTAAQ